MKKAWLIFIACFLLLTLPSALCPAMAEEAAEQEEPAEWTVMFYFCGSDLESRHGFASQDMEEIVRCCYPIAGLLWADEEEVWEPKLVNVLVETGGSKAWQCDHDFMDLKTDRLQRWRYDVEIGRFVGSLKLEKELPLESMASPAVLSDFIRWGTETYPAKKYALVIWGHGNGSKTGILSDELFNNQVMYLDDLRQALNDGGAYLEAVVLDACMMANLETACALQQHAGWMIASEEIVPGEGTAVGMWLQELYNHPEQNGKQLGRIICDMTQISYAQTDNEQSNALLTWSVVDLSKIPRVLAATERFFSIVNKAYQEFPELLYYFAHFMQYAEEYGDANQNMRDIASVFYSPNASMTIEAKIRNEMLDALNDAVDYCVRGHGRSEARGLSFCYGTDFSIEELEDYARNCQNPCYLAFLDAITAWTAPDWVYDTVEKLPEISTRREYACFVEKKMSAQGVPGLIVKDNYPFNGIDYVLYRVDDQTKQITRLGKTMCRGHQQESYSLWSAVDPWLWPSIDGEFCSIELISASETQALYNVPIQIGNEMWYLRYGREYEQFLHDLSDEANQTRSSLYNVFGLWEGYDDDSYMLQRNVKSLSQMVGQEYRMLYPVENNKTTSKTKYNYGEPHQLYRSMEMTAKPLPPGTYYLQYVVYDMFSRPINLDWIEMYWDGKALSFPAGFTWEGTIELQWQCK